MSIITFSRTTRWRTSRRRDFKMVLFPPVMLLFFLGAIATPIALLLLLFAMATPNVAWLYVAVAMSYFLTYEWLHFSYHLECRLDS